MRYRMTDVKLIRNALAQGCTASALETYMCFAKTDAKLINNALEQGTTQVHSLFQAERDVLLLSFCRFIKPILRGSTGVNGRKLHSSI